MPQSAMRKRVVANRQQITAAKYNIRTVVVDVLNTYDRLGCDNIGPTAVDTQFRLSFWCTAAVGAVARMVGEIVTRSSTNGEKLHRACGTSTGVYRRWLAEGYT